MKPTRRDNVVLWITIVASISVFAMLLSACGAGDGIPTYKVNEDTGLYATFGNINAEQLMVLPKGTILIPADGESKLFCDSFTDAGMPYMLCKVDVQETGQTGWVLKLFVDKN